MRFLKLVFRCSCGTSATQISDVGLSRHHELVVQWTCSGCNQENFAVKALSDCWRACTPEADAGAGDSIEEPASFISDGVFLRSMRVKWPDE